MTTENQRRATAATQLLENPLFNEAFDTTREVLIQKIEDSDIIASEERNQIGLMLSCLANVKQQIVDNIDTARLDADDSRD